MVKEENKVIIPYGADHTRKYTKSVVADFLVQKSNESNAIHICSDVHLLLRQKNIHKVIGRDVLRSYLENLDNGAPHSHSFTDDELFSLIDPKGIGTITDAYEFSKYIQSHSDDLKTRYNELKEKKHRYDTLKNVK